MLSKKEIGMVALAGVGIVGIGWFMGDGAASGGARAGKILGSPGGLTAESFSSTGVSSPKLAAAAMPFGARTKVTPQIREEFGKGKGIIPSKTAFVGKQVSPTYIPEAATQAYITQAGGYVAPTFTGGVGGKIIGGRYTPPTGLYPSKTQAGLTSKGLATQKKVSARSTGRAPSSTKLTPKGTAVKKRVAARQARSG